MNGYNELIPSNVLAFCDNGKIVMLINKSHPQSQDIKNICCRNFLYKTNIKKCPIDNISKKSSLQIMSKFWDLSWLGKKI